MTDSTPRTSAITVLIADDEHLIRSALATMLDLEDDITVLAQAATGDEAVALARSAPVDVALLDLQMPGLDGIETAQAIRRDHPDTAILIVTSHGRPGYLKRALEVGARGFMPKTAQAGDLAAAIRTLASGGRAIDPELATDALTVGDSPLTAREADVLEFSVDGADVSEIARRAHLSEGTTRNYLSAAVTKLGARNRHEASAIAREHGWI
ncbi:DNA-binding response regulator [Brevibacterium sp. CS2]|uniref:response regulator transcription factor n=1 Tax=Brevibacterium sp. CS2 TaxID=2575923 RepID=UPI0010C7CF18|nr:response regulator transcription factor [Brevibacterium sp. CS2]QCP05009.1 response regulator transcription factor [Brevibacterium sp. CS2]